MAWISLIFAGICEMIGVTMINKHNQTKSKASLLLLVVGFGTSFVFLEYAMKTLPMGTAYAIWTGIGASGGAIIGMLKYGESKDWRRVVCIAMVICSAIGLKLVS